MSNKSRSRKSGSSPSTTGSARTLKPVTDSSATSRRHTYAEDKLWKVLHANSSKTTTELSALADIGKSTAQKILVGWETERTVTRIPGIAQGGRRAADRWVLTEADAAEIDPALLETPTESSSHQMPDVNVGDVQEPGDDELDSAQIESGDAEEDQPGSVDRDTAEGDKAPPRSSVNTTHAEGKRLRPGELYGMVEDYLRDHQGERFSPTMIAAALGGKSSGAVSNALDKMVASGLAVLVNEKPKRFMLTAEEQATVSASAR